MEKTILFFDKYAGNHVYSNPITRKVNINYLSRNNGYKKLIGSNAIDAYNSLPYVSFKIGDLDKSLYKVCYYSRMEENKIESGYTVIEVNTEKLYDLVKNDKKIPQQEFLKILFKYHSFYEKSSNNKSMFNDVYSSALEEKKFVGGNIHQIIKNVLEATKYSNKIIKDDLDRYITVKLFNYQKASIKWMINKEKKRNEISYSTTNDILLKDDLFFDINKEKFKFNDTRKKIKFNGGAIIDEVGLGKTLQITTLALNNKKQKIRYIENNKFQSRATLILCPNHLCGQWKRELTKMIDKNYDLNIISILTKRHFEKYTYDDLLNADFVIVSFTFLGNNIFINEWMDKVREFESGREYIIHNEFKSNSFNHDIIKILFNASSSKLVEDDNNMYNKKPLIQFINWHRFVIDEFHEIYTNKKYIYVKNMVPHITSTYKWVVTGTPFTNDDNLYQMVNFLTNYNNKDGRQLLSSPSIINYLSTDCFRRNTKDSVIEEFKLTPYTEKIFFLNFTQTERAMYNAYLANPNNDKYGVYIRQLCCHPNLANETKEALAKCKTLGDIEKMMIVHYRNIAKNQKYVVSKLKKRLLCLTKKIKEAEQDKKLRTLKTELKKNNIDIENMEDIQLYTRYKQKYNQDYIKKFPDEEDESDYDDIDRKFEDSQTELQEKLAVDEKDNEIDIIIKKSPSLFVLKETLTNVKERYLQQKKIYKGHKTTYVFFSNVIDKIKNTINKEKEFKEDDDIDEEMNAIDFLNMESDEDSETEETNEDKCSICLEEMVKSDIGVTKCGHLFCYSCLLKTYENSKRLTRGNAKCPVCRKIIGENSFYKLKYKENKVELNEDKSNINKNTLIDRVGTKLAELIYFLKENNEHTIIFSQWDDLLKKVGKILNEYGIKNIFCRGNVYQKDKAVSEFNTNDNIRVIMLSSDSAAAGTNLTKATRIILLDPVYGEYEFRKGTEGQAIGRAHRLGQKNKLEVCRFIIKNSIEHDIYKKNIEEDKKYPEFEGRTIIEKEL